MQLQLCFYLTVINSSPVGVTARCYRKNSVWEPEQEREIERKIMASGKGGGREEEGDFLCWSVGFLFLENTRRHWLCLPSCLRLCVCVFSIDLFQVEKVSSSSSSSGPPILQFFFDRSLGADSTTLELKSSFNPKNDQGIRRAPFCCNKKGKKEIKVC